MAKGKSKTSINIDTVIYLASKERAAKLGIDFGELCERSLARDLKERMAILRTESGVTYAPIIPSAESHLPLGAPVKIDNPVSPAVPPPPPHKPEPDSTPARDGGKPPKTDVKRRRRGAKT